MAALLDGTVDLAYGLDGADLPDLRRRRFVVHSGSVPYIWYLIFNMSDPVLADCRVRQAIAHAFDRETLSNDVFRGQTRPANGVLPPASPAYDPHYVDPYPYDPERARELLSQAVLPDDWALRVMFATAGSAQLQPPAIIKRLANDLAKVGVRMERCPHEDWVEYCKAWQNGMPPHIGMSEMSWGHVVRRVGSTKSSTHGMLPPTVSMRGTARSMNWTRCLMLLGMNATKWCARGSIGQRTRW